MFRQIVLLAKKMIRKFGFGWKKEWERCTICTKKAIFFAEDIARKLNHNQITPEHFLLGLIHEEDNNASYILKRIGIDLTYFRQILEESFANANYIYDLRQVTKEISLTSRGKRVLELACAKADELRDNYIGTEHLLYGILREGGLVTQILDEFGVNVEIVDRELLKLKEENFLET